MVWSCGLLALELAHRRDLEGFEPVSYGSLKCCQLNLMGLSGQSVEGQNTNRLVDREAPDHKASERSEDLQELY